MDISFLVQLKPSGERGSIEGEVSGTHKRTTRHINPMKFYYSFKAVIEVEKYSPLTLRVSGECCKLPEPTETILFDCVVREQQTRSVVVANDTNVPWKLKPQVSGNYFSVDEVLHVPAKGFASCLVTYTPLVTNTEDALHIVTDFVIRRLTINRTASDFQCSYARFTSGFLFQRKILSFPFIPFHMIYLYV